MIFEVGNSGQVQFMTAAGQPMQLGEKVTSQNAADSSL